MSKVRTINHPGVEFRENDMSSNPPAAIGNTVVFAAGFAAKGEELSPKTINSISELNGTFGTPTNEAERYMYEGCSNALDNGAQVIATRIPYESTNATIDGNYQYFGLKFETSATTISGVYGLATSTVFSGDISGNPLNGISGYVMNQTTVKYISPFSSDEISNIYAEHADVSAAIFASRSVTSAITSSGYDTISTTSNIATVLAGLDIAVVVEKKNVVSGPLKNEGYVVVATDFYDAVNVQRLVANGDTLMDAIKSINVTQLGSTQITNDMLAESLSDYFSASSTSEDVMKLWPTIDVKTALDGNGDVQVNGFSDEYKKYIGVTVLTVSSDGQNGGKLYVTSVENFVGSINPYAKNTVTGQSTYVGDLVNKNSDYIKFYVNKTTVPALLSGALSTTPFYIGDVYTKTLSSYVNLSGSYAPAYAEGTPVTSVTLNTYDLIGFENKTSTAKNISVSGITASLDLAFEQVSNIDDIQIDIVADFGLSTIAQEVSNGNTRFVAGEFTANSILQMSDVSAWRSVIEKLKSFCANTRKDCMAVVDAPRNLGLQGDQKRIRKTNPQNTFMNSIVPQLKYIVGVNSSYVAMYTDWVQAYDSYNGINYWAPQSVRAVGVYVYTDNVGDLWDAPAGLNRGSMSNISDIAFNPKNKEADAIYQKAMNYGNFYQNEGYFVEGQKTTQTKSSAFDRVNVRRLFLRMERYAYKASRYFVMQPNNIFTRRSISDVMNNYLSDLKIRGGLYDFKVVCDETNNTPDVEDRNELRVAILVKPVRTAEFIIIDFVATRSNANFDEILQQVL